MLPPAHRALAKSLNVNRRKTRHRRKPAPGPSPLRKQVTLRNNRGIGRALEFASSPVGAPWLTALDSPAPAGTPAVLPNFLQCLDRQTFSWARV